MDLIYHRGLNCHLASLVNIAAGLGVNYTEAFASLWGETDFADEEKYNIFTSKRVFASLEAQGLATVPLACGETSGQDSLICIPLGGMLLVGMDTFFIPWHPVFRHFRGPHFFFAKKEEAGTALCFDPVYGEKNTSMALSYISSCAFELSCIHKIPASPPDIDIAQKAEEVLRLHPQITDTILNEIQGCRLGGRGNIPPLIKRLNAMLNNRYLFGQFLQSGPRGLGGGLCFDDCFFRRWEGVINGLYKASIMKDNESVIDEVCSLFFDLMHEEMTMAEEIISHSRPA